MMIDTATAHFIDNVQAPRRGRPDVVDANNAVAVAAHDDQRRGRIGTSSQKHYIETNQKHTKLRLG